MADRKYTMADFQPPALQKRGTYHIIPEDEVNLVADPLMPKSPDVKTPIVVERPRSSASSHSSRSSTTLQEKRLSTRSGRQLYKKRQRPLIGDRFVQAWRKTPLFFKALVIIFFTGIPFAVFTIVTHVESVGLYYKCIGDDQFDVRWPRFALYLTIAWGTLLVIIVLAEGVSRFFSWLCSKASCTIRYAQLANVMSFRLTMMFWIAAMRLATCRMFASSMDTHDDHANWIRYVRLILEFLAIVLFILVIQGTLISMIAIAYVQGYIGPRSQNAVNELETLRRLNHLVRPRRIDHKSRLLLRFIKKIFLPPQSDLFDAIRKGRSTDAEVRGYASILWTTVADNKSEVTIVDIYDRLVALNRHTDCAGDLFDLIDSSGDGVANRTEFEELVAHIAWQLKKRAAAMRGISLLLRKLEVIFSLMVVLAVLFVWYALFRTPFGASLASMWAGVAGVAFLFASPVADLIHACVWVFARHSYDVGDRVEILGKQLEVMSIYLTHTNFEELDVSGGKRLAVQIGHVKLAGETLVNHTRSEDPMDGYIAMSRATTFA